jgi:DNA-binding transcriptional LysR family regulator
MEWQQLKGFYHAAKLGSVTRAAEATYRTQSALTQQIASLERELECPLFERVGKRKIVLTPAGERLFRFAESILQEHAKLLAELGEQKGVKRGRLRIAAPFTTLYHLLPKVLKNYHERHPWVELTVLDRTQREVVGLVKSGDVDFGVVLESMVPRDLFRRRWVKVEPVLMTPVGHPLASVKRVSLERIAHYPLIMPPKSTDHFHRSNLEELFRRHGLEYTVVMESSSVELSSLYVETGLGISFASIVKNLPVFRKRRIATASLTHLMDSEYLCIAARSENRMLDYHTTFLGMIV